MKNFINVVTSEEEQVEQIKKWIKENSLSVIAGITIGFGGIFGVGFYNDYVISQNLEARVSYLNNEKIADHKSYLTLQNMLNAKNQIIAGDITKVSTLLENDNNDSILKDVKNLRLAQIYLEQKKFDEALNILKNNTLKVSAEHLRGDIYLAQGKMDLALAFYKLAKKITQNDQVKAILDIKINNLK